MKNNIDIKQIFSRVKTLVINPAKEWNKIKSEEPSTKELFYDFAFPFLAVCSAFIFLGRFMEDGLITGFKCFLVSFISMSTGMYAGAKILKEMTASNENTTESDCFKMVIYSSSVFCLFHGFSGLFGSHSILSNLLILTQFIAVWTIWYGTKPIIKTTKNNKTGYTLIISLLIILLPLIMEKLLTIIFIIPVAEF